MHPVPKYHRIPQCDITHDQGNGRRAVAYIRVSTDMQAVDGLSLDAQTAAIEQCARSMVFVSASDRPR